MKKVSLKKKIIPILVATAAVTSIFAFSRSSLAETKEELTDVSLGLNVEKVDKDTIKISLDELEPVIKSLQLGVKIDGDVKFEEDTIKWLIASEDENLKSNIKISEDKKNLDIFVVSTEALDKVGGKLEILEIDVNKLSGKNSKFKVVPKVDNGIAYSYLLSDTNKQRSGVDIGNVSNAELSINSAPKLELVKSPSVVEGKIVLTVDSEYNLKDYVIATDEEDGEINKDNIEVTGKVEIDKVGSYSISYSVKDSEGEISTLDTTVIVEKKVEEAVEKPIITVTNKTITIKKGEEVNLLDGVIAKDYLGREIEVFVTGDYDVNIVGSYTIKYNATDRLGNKADEQSSILVVEEIGIDWTPIDPSNPIKPGDPGTDWTPIDPSNPVKPEEPGIDWTPIDPSNPVKPGEPGTDWTPVDPSKPVKPEEPGNPENPDTPSEEIKPSDEIKPEENNKGEGNDLPATGDVVSSAVVIIIGIVILAGGIIIFTKKKK